MQYEIKVAYKRKIHMFPFRLTCNRADLLKDFISRKSNFMLKHVQVLTFFKENNCDKKLLKTTFTVILV